MEYYEECLKIDREVVNQQGAADTLANMGIVFAKQHEYDKALIKFNESLSLYISFGNRDREASTLDNVGNLYKEKGDVGKAKSYYEKSMNIYKELHHQGRVNEIKLKLNHLEMS